MSAWLEFHGQLRELYAKYPAESARYESEYDALAARLAEAERDAARYRWLRDVSEDDSVVSLPSWEWDKAIDAELADSANEGLKP